MARTLSLQVVTPEKILLDLEAEAVMVPAAEGFMGILPNHAPIIAGLQPGYIKYRQEGKDYYCAVSGGFMEVSRNKVTILAEAAERQEDIDVFRAEAALERALQRLHERPPDLDLKRAELALKRAHARLKTVRHK